MVAPTRPDGGTKSTVRIILWVPVTEVRDVSVMGP